MAERIDELLSMHTSSRLQSPYGAAAFRQLLAFLWTLPLGPAGAVFLFCNQKNTVGWNLYGAAGFRQTRIFNTLHERLAVTCIS